MCYQQAPRLKGSVSSRSVAGALGWTDVCELAMNESALPEVEMLQMTYHVTGSVEAIYRKVSKWIRLQPLYKSIACGTVCCTMSTQASSRYQKEGNHRVG